MIKTAIITVSDSCSAGKMEDGTGPALQEFLDSNFEVVDRCLVSDDKDKIVNILKELCDQKDVQLILTNGGTGFSPRDVTPEATHEVIDKVIPGLPELMRRDGSQYTQKAFLSRAIAGIRKDKTIIVNLPGSPKGAVESFSCIQDLLPHAFKMLEGEKH